MSETRSENRFRPAVTVDVVLLSSRRSVLLVKRKCEPFKGRWALPGGFLEKMETLAAAAARELEEETGLAGIELHQLRAFDDPDRDPRGRTISIAFLGIPNVEAPPQAGSDAADCRWVPLDHLPPMAFDHDCIVACAVETVASEQA